MKNIFLILTLFAMLVAIPAASASTENPTDCTFGGKSTLPGEIFEKDFAVKAFVEKHPDATRTIPTDESGSLKNQLVLQSQQNDGIKEKLKVQFHTDTNGCYIPASYRYSYDDGIIDVTVRNSVANFTEIMNLIKSDVLGIEDFYPDDCTFVDLDVSMSNGKSYGVCKEAERTVTILIDAASDGSLKVDIPIEMVYSLPSSDCIPTGDFFVMLDKEETRYDITPTETGNQVTVEFPEGFHKIIIAGSVIIPNPSPAQYCGIVEGYLDKKYLAPLDQTDHGVSPKSIRCNENLILVQKYDETPACVKYETKEKLAKRGWTAETKQNLQSTDTGITPMWQYNAEGKILAIRISDDGSKIAISSQVSDKQDKIYLFDANNGSLLWDHTLDRKMGTITISSDGSYVAISGFQLSDGRVKIYQNGTVSLFDSVGNVLWTHNVEDNKTLNSLWIDADGSKVMFGTGNKITSVDRQGDTVWQTNAEQFFESVAFSSNGYFAASSGPEVLFFDDSGKQLWSFITKHESNYATVISQDGKNIVISDSSGTDGNIYYLDSDGNLLWEHHLEEAALHLSISQDKSRLMAANNWQYMMFDIKGNLLWTNNIPSDVAISSDVSFIVGTTFNQVVGPAITFINIHGDITSYHPLENHILFSLSDDDRYLAVTNGENRDKLVVFEVADLRATQSKISLSEMQTSSDLHVMAVLQDKKYTLDVTVDQGQTMQMPWNISVDEGYATTNLSVSAESSHAELESWIIPYDPYTAINGIPPSDKVITIHSSFDTPVGNHVVNIVGNVHSVHNQTGWMTSLENKILGKINVSVNSSDDSLSIDVGKPDYERQSFYISEESGNGQTCSGGPTYQKVPITVFSEKIQTVHLEASITQKGGGIKFIPDELKTGPEGATSEMMMAGYMIPFKSNPLAEQPLIIEATFEDGETITEVIPVRFGDISVITDDISSAISLNRIKTNSNGTNFSISGIVYDSVDNAEPLSVNMSILGLLDDDGGEVTDLPTWLSIDIPKPSFVLNANVPYHFTIVAKTVNAPESGTYHVAINQDIGGQNFIELQKITIMNRR